MNLTYLAIDGVFLVIPVTILVRASVGLRRRMLQTVTCLFALTVVFDNLLIAAGIVAYNPGLTSGLKLGLAPVEDFAYCVAAATILPYLWEKFTRA